MSFDILPVGKYRARAVDAVLGETKTGKELVDLPIAITSRSGGSTSPMSTLTTQPGVQTDASGAISVIGTKPSMLSVSIDGISTMGPRTSAPLAELFPSFNAIAEIRVSESNNSAEFGGIDEEVECEGGLVAVALGKAAHKVNQVSGLHADGSQVSDKGAEVGTFVADGLLEVAEAGGGMIWGNGHFAAEDVELNLDTEQGLQDAVVEVAGDAGTLGFDGAGA